MIGDPGVTLEVPHPRATSQESRAMPRHLPRIVALSGAEAARASQVLVHSPVLVEPGAHTWTITLLDPDGALIAQSRALAPDLPVPLAEIARLHLDVVGLEAGDRWHELTPEADGPRFSATVRTARPRE